MDGLAGVFVVVVVGLAVAGAVFWIWALVQVIKRPFDTDYVHGNQIVWLLCLLFLNMVGAVLYLVLGHRQEIDRR